MTESDQMKSWKDASGHVLIALQLIIMPSRCSVSCTYSAGCQNIAEILEADDIRRTSNKQDLGAMAEEKLNPDTERCSVIIAPGLISN